jgi:hypothetical protein
MLAERCLCLYFGSVLNQPFAYQFLDESSGGCNICAAAPRRELSKAEDPWQPAKNGAGKIVVRFHPFHAVLDLKIKTTGTDSVDG